MSSLPTASDEIPAFARALIVAGGYNGFSYADIADLVGIRTPHDQDNSTRRVSRMGRSGELHRCVAQGGLGRNRSETAARPRAPSGQRGTALP